MDVGAVGGGSLAAGLSGLQKGQEQVTEAAQEIASANTQGSQNTTNLSSSLVEQTEGVRQVEASAKVVEAADKSVGSLLDVKA